MHFFSFPYPLFQFCILIHLHQCTLLTSLDYFDMMIQISTFIILRKNAMFFLWIAIIPSKKVVMLF